MSFFNVTKNLGTVHPFGPFNRFVYEPDSLYLESGMLKYDMFYFRPESYQPARWQFNPNFSKVGGRLYLETHLVDGLLVEDYFGRVYRVKGLKFFPMSSEQNFESKAIGCDPKTDTFTMINPRGEEATCTYTVIPRFKRDEMHPNPSSLGSLMDYVEAQGVFAASAIPPTGGGVQERCVKPERTSQDFGDEGNKIYCTNEIMFKKFCRTLFPPSMFSGKLRLYIQSLYGGTAIKYKLEGGMSAFASLYVGLHPGENVTDRAPRLAVFGRGTHWMFTQNYHHFLINSMNLAVNPLVPIGKGHMLKRWLQANPEAFDQDTRDNIEAYLLSASAPTYTLFPAERPTADLTRHGRGFDFGFNGNWDGSRAVMVANKKDGNNYRITSIVTVTVECSGLEDVLETELKRKCDSLKLDWDVKHEVATYPFGVYRRYVTEAFYTEIPDPDNPENMKGVFFGDIDDGEWWYAIHIAVGDEQADKKALEEEARSKNRRFGGQPYTEDCLNEIATCFSFAVHAESSEPWMEPLQTDKIFRWDRFYSDYEWVVPCYPRDPYDQCKEPVAGEFPVYAWYNRAGEMIIASYYYRKMTAAENEEIPPEGLCGPGHDEESYKRYNNGIVTGWTVKGANVRGKSYNYQRRKADMTITSGKWDKEWSVGCGSSFCDDTSNPPGGGIGYFWTHWGKSRRGGGNINVDEGSGSQGHFTFLLIPKDDCQALHIGMLEQATEQTHQQQTVLKDCVNAAQSSGIMELGKPKPVGADSWGGLTCKGIYFAKSFGWVAAEGFQDSVGHPQEFATYNWCIYYPGGSEVGRFSCNFRKWGPTGKDTGPEVGLTEPKLGTITSNIEKDFVTVTAKHYGVYINPKGDGYTTVERSASGTGKDNGEAQENLKIDIEYPELLTRIDLKWPYAGCGPIYNSWSTVNKSGFLCRIFGGDYATIPKDWPFEAGYIYAVGYV